MGIAGGLLAIGVGVAALKQMEAQAELKATPYLLANHLELLGFSLQSLDFDGKKLKDLFAVCVISYKMQEFTPEEK